MIDLLFVVYLVTIRVFKKTSSDGNVTVYLGKRDFVNYLNHTDTIDGVAVVEPSYLNGRKVYSKLTATNHFGREEGQLIDVNFGKEIVISNTQIVPPSGAEIEITPTQDRLMKKFGVNAVPFNVKFPPNIPTSIELQNGEDDHEKALGVEYSITVYVGDNANDNSEKKSAVVLAIKRIQYTPPNDGNRLPSALVYKGFNLSPSQLNLVVNLDKKAYYHDENIQAHIIVSNNSQKTVKSIKVIVVQHCELTMVKTQFSRHVAVMETYDGCPIIPGASLRKSFFLVPQASSDKARQRMSLDGFLKEDAPNAAPSLLIAEGFAPTETMGFVITYSIRVKLNCGALGGDLQADVPFNLIYPAPGPDEAETVSEGKTFEALEAVLSSNDDSDNIVFKDFTRLCLNNNE